jgi:hypothetical protein
MANLFDWLPTTATAMQLVIAPGAYLWLIVACLVCLKVWVPKKCDVTQSYCLLTLRGIQHSTHSIHV